MDFPDDGLFRFESEYSDDLKFIPIGIRYRLDLAGLKLGLGAWLDIPVPERFFLLKMPMQTEWEIADFRERLSRSTADYPPTAIDRSNPKEWANSLPPPKSVTDACKSAGIPLDETIWIRMPELQRFALKKLSTSKRQPDAFRKALDEFGVVLKDPPE